ncbi:PhzF family phenazine biosynthesis protein [Halopseudomonas nanhaiensis]|uniref:PhzF family phenazine biosynthesis protein n=1 Tax=Halopseudomonas nanhaiensis TaxID=2830842 RepID=UPI001CBAE8B4|nr:PhzF family phenazine biosynthesis protein [Halopseudomonas nanhaiensis]UAW99485.1 PhzF family phenazine biosynthesis protein [Halopseudomonas nanhaiensis]
MRSVPFKQVDVFTRTPFKGNPVAVVLDAQGLSDEQMQQIANWTNLSETTFVFPATADGADYQLRIFTTVFELPFAGHPTIGTAHALLEAGLVEARNGRLVQQCPAGLVPLCITGAGDTRSIAFELPEPAFTSFDQAQVEELEAILGTPLVRQATPRLIDVGARWIVAQLPSADAVLACTPDFLRMRKQDAAAEATGVVIFGEYPEGSPARVETRAFGPATGIEEDPVCGSGNGCLAAFIRATDQTAHFGSRFVSSQGAALGRAGLIDIVIEPQRIQIGGAAVTCIDGSITL